MISEVKRVLNKKLSKTASSAIGLKEVELFMENILRRRQKKL